MGWVVGHGLLCRNAVRRRGPAGTAAELLLWWSPIPRPTRTYAPALIWDPLPTPSRTRRPPTQDAVLQAAGAALGLSPKGLIVQGCSTRTASEVRAGGREYRHLQVIRKAEQ